MVSGENGPLGLNAPYPAPMEPSIEHVPVLDHSTRDRIVQETTEKQQIVFQKSVQVSLRSNSKTIKWFKHFFLSTLLEFFPLKVDGVWNGWMQWSECTVSCGYGTRNRSRTCKGPYYKGKECDGPKDETESCNAFSCPGRRIWSTEKVYNLKINLLTKKQRCMAFRL